MWSLFNLSYARVKDVAVNLTNCPLPNRVNLTMYPLAFNKLTRNTPQPHVSFLFSTVGFISLSLLIQIYLYQHHNFLSVTAFGLFCLNDSIH